MSIEPTYFRVIKVLESIIYESEEFFQYKGKKGFESKVYWIGKRTTEDTAIVTKVFIPKQYARKSLYGVSVEVPEEGNLELIESLKDDELALIKLHTHPKDSFLSKTDIANPFFRHEGAVSIVIPNFCSKSLSNFAQCCVNVFKNGKWVTLNKKEIFSLLQIER